MIPDGYDLLRLVVGGVLVVIFAYLSCRASTVAYYRSRLEYMTQLLKLRGDRRKTRHGEDR
jgi:hypothetical protein